MTDAHMSASKLHLRKINIFHTISDEVDFYIKIVALDEMYNYVEFFVHLRSLRC
jgi:hypothetical protein